MDDYIELEWCFFKEAFFMADLVCKALGQKTQFFVCNVLFISDKCPVFLGVHNTRLPLLTQDNTLLTVGTALC